MPSIDLAPYRNAIAERLCKPCAEGSDAGVCCRPGGDPCALTAHADVVVEAFTRLGRGRQPDDYSRAIERKMCDVCQQDHTGHCSLLELMIDIPDERMLQIVDVILDVHEGNADVDDDDRLCEKQNAHEDDRQLRSRKAKGRNRVEFRHVRRLGVGQEGDESKDG